MSIRNAPLSVRLAAMLVGLVAALAPAALLAYDGQHASDGDSLVAQASPTAAPKATAAPTTTAAPKAATPAAAPKTGNAGMADSDGGVGVASLLIALTVGVVLGGRVLAVRRN